MGAARPVPTGREALLRPGPGQGQRNRLDARLPAQGRDQVGRGANALAAVEVEAAGGAVAQQVEA